MNFLGLSLFFITFVTSTLDAKNLELSIIHMNDTHSHFDESKLKMNLSNYKVKVPVGGYERLFQRVQEKKRALKKQGKNVLVFHGGDAFQGTIYFTQNKGKMNAEAWNLMELDAMALGNHEFDIGSEKLGEFLSSVGFPVLAANIDVSKNKFLKSKIKPYTIKIIDGKKVAIVGLTPENLNQLSLIDKNIIVKREIESSRNTIKQLKKMGVDHVIVLDHIGYQNDLKLAKNVDGIDVIVGGHSHTLLGDFKGEGLKYSGKYPSIVKRKSGEKTCIVQAWQYSRTLGEIHIKFDKNGNLSSCKGNPELLLGKELKVKSKNGWGEPNKKVSNKINSYVLNDEKLSFVAKNKVAVDFMGPYRKSKRAFGDKVIAHFDRDYTHERSEDKSKLGVPFKNKSQMAKLVADAYKFKGSQIKPNLDFTMINSGRTEIMKGQVAVNDVYEFPLQMNTTSRDQG